MNQYIVTNAQGTKGIIQPANNMDEARQLATENFYSPFPRKNDLTVTQMYEPNKHMFVRAGGNKSFKKVQYHTLGGVATSNNCSIDTPPTQKQIEFLRNKIEYILFSDE